MTRDEISTFLHFFPEAANNITYETTIMQHPPQSVTIRYTRALLCDGQNDEFAVINLQCHASLVQGVRVGVYFEVAITTKNGATEASGVGPTPTEAVERALRKHGVTFR